MGEWWDDRDDPLDLLSSETSETEEDLIGFLLVTVLPRDFGGGIWNILTISFETYLIQNNLQFYCIKWIT